MANNWLVEVARPVVGSAPLNTTGAAVASPWVNMKFHRRFDWYIIGGAWAGGTPAVTLAQATNVSGSGSKTLGFTQYYNYSGQTPADIPAAPVAVTGNTFNLPAAANTLIQIEVHMQDLDLVNGFEYIQLNIASPGANADYICVLGIANDPRYEGKPTTLPSCLT